MENNYLVILGFILWCFSTHGLPHGGHRTPVKRSDYTMYDNQFFSVGDTALDNEVTDCAVVRHQYARGYIRLREYLERMQGCGRKGKQKNIEGIAAATKDTQALTSDGFHIPSNNVVNIAPFQPKPIGQILDDIDKTQGQVKAYNGQAKNLQSQLPFQQPATQRSHQNQPSFTNLGLLSKTNGALSFQSNIASHPAVLPVARKFISRQNLNTNPQVFRKLHNVRNRQQYYISPDPQRYYSTQTAEIKHAYSGSVTVGQPLLRPNPLAYHQETATGSKTGITQKDQMENGDLNQELQKQPLNALSGNRHDGIPENQNDHMQDDLAGGDDVKDEATEIGSIKSDPIPSDSQFTENPRLEKEEHQSEDKMDDSTQEPQQVNNEKLNSNEKTTQNPSAGGIAQVGKSSNADDIGANDKEAAHDDIGDKETTEEKESNKLDEFLKPSTNDEKEGDKNDAQSLNGNQASDDFAKERQQPSTSDKNNQDEGIAINLDVLKDKISSSRDIGFLKRMLTLIKKITHHKDFHKLAGAQKSAIMQAGKAVNSAVSEGTSHNTERSFIQPRPMNTSPNVGNYRGTAQAVNSYINGHPPKWKFGDRTLTGNAQAQFYQGKQNQITKKFQIERNPYYQQQRRVSYTPPYYSLQRLNYGLYNGNSP